MHMQRFGWIHRLLDPWTLLSFILIIAGADLILLSTKLSFIVGILPISIGIIILFWRLRAFKIFREWRNGSRIRTENEPHEREYIAEKIILKLSNQGKFLFLISPLGAFLIILLLLFNLYISGNPEFGTIDILAFAVGSFFVIYPFARKKFKRESDFILLFFIIISILLLLPMLIFFDPDKADTFVESPIVYYFLALPLTGILNVIGIQSHASNVVIYFSLHDGSTASVGIALSCSGIYSFLIFISAFIAFVLTEFTCINRKVAILALAGIILTYLANLFRMTLIIIAGYLNGIGPDTQPFTLLWTHKYAGEIIFIVWIAIFWWFAFKYLGKDSALTIKTGRNASKEVSTEVSDIMEDRKNQEEGDIKKENHFDENKKD